MDANEQETPPPENHVLKKDMAYSPASDRETARMQQEGVESEKVSVLPGTGGPDDSGDVQVDDSELNLEGTASGHADDEEL